MTHPKGGLLAEFETPEEVLHAAQSVSAEGYRAIEAYTPFPIDGLAEAIGAKRSRVSLFVLLGGICGGTTAYALQYFCVGVNYPISVAGRPLNSIPAFIPITFELTVLFASISAVLSVFFLSGLPRLWQPVFEIEAFKRASRDAFFLWVGATDSKFNLKKTTQLLRSLKARGVYEV